METLHAPVIFIADWLSKQHLLSLLTNYNWLITDNLQIKFKIT